MAGNDAADLELALKSAGAADASLLRPAVLRLAQLQQEAKSKAPPLPKQTAAEGARHLADWLSRAHLNDMVIDRTMETLCGEDVFTLDDLVLFSRMTRFDQVLTALTAQKLRVALTRDGHACHPPSPPPAPVPAPGSPVVAASPCVPPSPCESEGMPDWLTDAAAALDAPAASKAAEEAPAASRPEANSLPDARTYSAAAATSLGPAQQQGQLTARRSQQQLLRQRLAAAATPLVPAQSAAPTPRVAALTGAMAGGGVDALTGLPLSDGSQGAVHAQDGAHQDGPSRWGGPSQRGQSPGPGAGMGHRPHRSGSPRRRSSPRRGGGGGGGGGDRRSDSPCRERPAAAGAQGVPSGPAAGPETITVNSFLSEAIKAAEDAAADAPAGDAPPARGHSPFRSQSFKRRQQRRRAAERERQANGEQVDPNSAAA